MNSLVQYEGFIVSTTSRTYHFRVIDKPGAFRPFHIQIASESFRSTSLKFQDGPNISSERLKQELADETEDSHAKTNMDIGEQDIQSYLERHYPRKGSFHRPPRPQRPKPW